MTVGVESNCIEAEDLEVDDGGAEGRRRCMRFPAVNYVAEVLAEAVQWMAARRRRAVFVVEEEDWSN